MSPKKIVVIGAVAAGMSAASQAKRRMKDAEIIVFEKGNDVSYGACGMPYNVGDPDRDIYDLNVISAKDFREKRGIDLRTESEVTSIGRENKTVKGVDKRGGEFEETYDLLVIATGSRAVYPPVPGIDSEGVFPLRTLQHGAAMKEKLASGKVREAAVLGGSYLGLELAEALCHRGVKTTIVKRKPRMLKFLPVEFDEMIKEELAKNDVPIVHGQSIQEIQTSGRVKMILSESEIECDMITLGTGFAPRSELARDAGLELGPAGAIAVDEYGLTSDPNIYAIGDCSDNFHHLTGKRVWVPLALHANRAGRIVGANVSGDHEKLPPVLGTSAVRVFGLEAAGTGLTEKEAKDEGFSPVSSTIKSRTRAHAFPGAGTIHVHLTVDGETGRMLGGAIVGSEYAAIRINVLAAAVQSNMTVLDFSNLDLMYSPPFSPAWDPLLVCANQLVKKAGTAK